VFKDFLDKNPDQALFKNKKQIDRIIEKHKVDLNVPEPLCLDIYNKKIRTDKISITITEPHHNCLRVVHPPENGEFIVRKLSVTEHFRLMGFRDGEIKLNGQSYQQLCKRAGNGWDVNLVAILFNHIFKQLP
jgi:DNA (cytosine-5)-methyltransferase 1